MIIFFSNKSTKNFVKLHCVLKDVFIKKWFLFFCLTVYIGVTRSSPVVFKVGAKMHLCRLRSQP